MTFRACILNSVSKPSQATAEKFSLEEQNRDNYLSCQAHNWPVVEVITIIHSRDCLWLHEILRDCPPFAHLVSLIESGAIDLIVVRHYDRLWSNSSLQGQMSALCRQHKVQIFAILQPKEPIDPALLPRRPGLQGIMESLSGVLRDEEQNIRVARRAVGMEKRIIKGEHVWGPTTAYGFTRQDKALVVDESEWRWLEEMKRWVLEDGLGASGIEARLNRLGVPPPGAKRQSTPTRHGRWTRKTIKRILCNPLYAGITRWGNFSNDGQHRALFTAEEQARVLAVVSGPSARQGVYDDRLLSGLARCGYCGHAMSYCHSFGARYLRCSWHTNTRGAECQNNGHAAAAVHAYLLEAIYHASQDRDDWLAARRAQHDSAQIRERISAIEAQIREHQAAFARWSSAFEVGLIGLNELAAHRARILGGVEALKGERQTHTMRLDSESQALGAMEELSPGMEGLADQTVAEQRVVLVRLVERVDLVQGQPPAIHWR